jgi:hypothetical protein
MNSCSQKLNLQLCKRLHTQSCFKHKEVTETQYFSHISKLKYNYQPNISSRIR